MCAGVLLAYGFKGGAVAARVRFVLILGSAVGTAMGVWKYQGAVDAFSSRVSDAGDDFLGRVFQHYEEMGYFANQAGIAGYGAGITHPGGEALRLKMDLPPPLFLPPPSEAEYARVLLELGIVGWVFWYALRLAVIWALWRTYRNLQYEDLKLWAFLGFLFHVLNLLPGAIVLNHVLSMPFWFIAGFAFVLPKLEMQRRQKEQPKLGREIVGLGATASKVSL